MKKIQNIIFPITILFLIILIDNNKNNNIFIDIKEAKNASIKEDRPLLIVFDQDYSEKANLKYIKTYVICVLDCVKDKEIFEEYKIKKIPSYIVIDNKTNVIYKEEGSKSKKGLSEWLLKIKNKTIIRKK